MNNFEKNFEWKCVILDDSPEDLKTIMNDIRDNGIRCSINNEDDPIKSLGDDDFMEEIRSAHIIFIDMHWLGFGFGEVGCTEPGYEILRENINSSSKKFKEWCVQYSRNRRGKSNYDANVGYLIGAAISQFNSDAIIIFCSQKDLTLDFMCRVLGLFQPSPYLVTQKDPHSIINTLKGQIDILIKKIVSSNEQFRRWIIGQVILPVCLGLEPIAGTCVEMNVVGFPERGVLSLNPSKVLPLFGGPEWDLSRLEKYLPSSQWRPSMAEQRVVISVRHDLAQMREDAIAGRPVQVGVRLRGKCADAGILGQRISLPVWEALQRPTVEFIEKALVAIEIALRDDLSSLYDYVHKQTGAFDCDKDLRERIELKRPENYQTINTLPFDLQHLQLAVDALQDNLKKAKPNGKSRVDCYMSAPVGRLDGNIVITYYDNSPGFPNLKAFAQAVKNSLKKTDALDRGLPLALAFPFFFPIVHMSVLTTDGRWNDFKQISGGKFPLYESGWAFGVRWAFKWAGKSKVVDNEEERTSFD